MSRGNERKPIVRDDADREKRLDWLRRTVETYGWRLHAVVLMSTHDHLFVETPEPNLLEDIVDGVATYFGHDRSLWRPGRRVDDASRAVAAYLARCRFGYRASEVAEPLGYRGHGGVHTAVARVEAGSAQLRKTADRLAQRKWCVCTHPTSSRA